MTEIAVEASAIPAQLPNVSVAVLGAGKMGGILLQAFLKQNLFAADQIHATVAHVEKALARSAQWGVDVSTDNLAAAKQADLILLGVKLPFLLFLGVLFLVARQTIYGLDLARNHYPFSYLYYYVPAAFLYVGVLWASYRSHIKGKIAWKGREYSIDAPESVK